MHWVLKRRLHRPTGDAICGGWGQVRGGLAHAEQQGLGRGARGRSSGAGDGSVGAVRPLPHLESGPRAALALGGSRHL